MAPKACFLFVIAAGFLLSGCLDLGGLSPEEEVEQAIGRLETGMGPDGDVKRLNGEFEAEGMKMDMEIEFGSNEALRMHVDAGMFQVVITCVDDRSYISLAGEAYESRFDEEMCDLDSDEGPDLIDEEAETEILRIEEQDDGSLLAEIRQTEDGEETLMTLVVRDGKVVTMGFEDDEASGSFDVEYGTRRTISAPSTDGKIPVSVDWTTTFTPGRYEGTIEEVDATAPLHEFEARAYEYSEDPTASFPIDRSGTQTQGGFQFTFYDDGDDVLSEGDRFVFERSGWEYEFDYEVVLFDEWAGLRTDEHPIPASGLFWVVLAGLVIFAAKIRGRR